jgi:hypothetical protein
MLWQPVLYYGGLECRSAWGESWLPVGIPHRPIDQNPESELRLPPCRKYTRACSCSYKYMRTSAIKTRHDAIAKCKYLILWAGSWIRFIKTVRTKKIEAGSKSYLNFEMRAAWRLDCLSVDNGWFGCKFVRCLFRWLAFFQSYWSFECPIRFS